MDYEYYESLTEEQQEIADRIHEMSYEEGFEDGLVDNTGFEEGKVLGREEGIKFERNRVYHICTMQMRWAEQADKAKDYLMWKNVREFLNPENFQPMSEEEFDILMEEF